MFMQIKVNMYKFLPSLVFLSLSLWFAHMHIFDFLLLLYVFCQPNLCNPHPTARQTGPPKWMSLNLAVSVVVSVQMCVWERHSWEKSQVKWLAHERKRVLDGDMTKI